MSYDYGPLQTYEITWTSGHTEQMQCHQISYSGGGLAGLDALAMVGVKADQGPRRVTMHGMFGNHWRLVLSALEKDIRTIRLVTGGEEFAGERFDFKDEGGGAA